MRVGNLTIEPDVLLAPMAAVTDLPFRTVCEELGVGLTITEFLSAHALAGGDKKTIEQDDGVARRPSRSACRSSAARPTRWQQRRADGGRDRRLARRHQHGLPGQARGRRRVRLGADARAASWRRSWCARSSPRCRRDMPVTVKHRAGWDERQPQRARVRVRDGRGRRAMITVHGRTRTQGFSRQERSRHHQARARRGAARTSRSSATATSSTSPATSRMREETGCDAVMIGRGALGNPWLFRGCARSRRRRRSAARRRSRSALRVFRRHVDLIDAHTPPAQLVHEVRKASRGTPRACAARRRCASARSTCSIRRKCARSRRGYFSSLIKKKSRRREIASIDDKFGATSRVIPPRAMAPLVLREQFLGRRSPMMRAVASSVEEAAADDRRC